MCSRVNGGRARVRTCSSVFGKQLSKGQEFLVGCHRSTACCPIVPSTVGILSWQEVVFSCVGRLSTVDEVQSQNLVNAGFSAEKPTFGSVCTSGGGPGLQNQWGV